jgi:uracil-DNA glycosylase family 4
MCEIEIISPKLLVLLGKTAVKGLCHSMAGMNMESLRAQSKSLGMVSFQGVPAIVTYHPSALLRTPWRRKGALEDFKFIQETYKNFLLIEG